MPGLSAKQSAVSSRQFLPTCLLPALFFEEISEAPHFFAQTLFTGMDGVEVERQDDPDGNVSGKQVIHGVDLFHDPGAPFRKPCPHAAAATPPPAATLQGRNAGAGDR